MEETLIGLSVYLCGGFQAVLNLKVIIETFSFLFRIIIHKPKQNEKRQFSN